MACGLVAGSKVHSAIWDGPVHEKCADATRPPCKKCGKEVAPGYGVVTKVGFVHISCPVKRGGKTRRKT